MADQLYLSLWFPNFRLATLPAALAGVLQQFARIAAEGKENSPLARVAAATVYPIDWTESPTWQRIFVNDQRSQEYVDSTIENAVAEATEQLHDDCAYEFEMNWLLWQPDAQSGTWKLQPARVRIAGFGPDFDAASWDQNGHIRVDFGLDAAWVQEDEDLDADMTKFIQQNVEKLLAFVLSVEKHCGISSRLLWTESGEPLAEKLVARLQRVN